VKKFTTCEQNASYIKKRDTKIKMLYVLQ